MPAPVPYDPELLDGLAAFKANLEPDALTADSILTYRARFAAVEPSIAELVAGRQIEFTDLVVPGPPGEPDITVSVLRSHSHAPGQPTWRAGVSTASTAAA